MTGGADTNMPDATQPTDAPATPDAGMAPAMGAPDAGAEAPMPMDAPEEAPMPEDGGEATDSPENNGDTSEIDELWGQLNTEDKAAALKYIKSMTDEDEGDEESEGPAPEEAPMPEDGGAPAPEEAPMPDLATDPTAGAAPLGESVVFTKAQLRRLNEGLGVAGLEDLDRKDVNPTKKAKKTMKKDSKRNDNPFNSPRK